MQLDNTRIAIRERNLPDTLDLALHVIRQYPRELLLTFLLAAVPLAMAAATEQGRLEHGMRVVVAMASAGISTGLSAFTYLT